MAVGVLHDVTLKTISKKVKENEGSGQTSSGATSLAPQRYSPPSPSTTSVPSTVIAVSNPSTQCSLYSGVFTHDVGQGAFLKTVKGDHPRHIKPWRPNNVQPRSTQLTRG